MTAPARLLICLGALLVPALAAGWLAAPALSRDAAPVTRAAPPAITVTAARREVIAASIPVSGSLVAREEVLVVPEIDGLSVIELLVEAGDRVEAGQVLARLNRDQLDVQLAQNIAQRDRVRAAIAQATAQIAEAEANVELARNALDRAEQLRLGRSTTADVLDQRIAQARSSEARLAVARQTRASAEADLAVAEAQGREIELRIARAEIKAPRAGVVSRRTTQLGSVATMGAAEPMFRIIADGAVELEADVPEKDLPSLKPGMPVRVWPAGQAEVRGEIRLVSPEVDRQTRLGKVRVALTGLPASSVGSFGRAEIETARREGVTVPVSALGYRRDETSVSAVDNGTVRIRKVRVGLVGNGRAEILEGLAEGETVVARAGSFVRDGDAVTPVPVN